MSREMLPGGTFCEEKNRIRQEGPIVMMHPSLTTSYRGRKAANTPTGTHNLLAEGVMQRRELSHLVRCCYLGNDIKGIGGAKCLKKTRIR